MTEPEGPTIGDELRTGLRRLARATIVVYIVLAALVAFVFIDGAKRRNDLADVAFSTNHALCALRADLEQRVADGRTFLLTHPNGIAGIPAASLQQSIDNQQRTIDTLSDLNC